MRLLKPFIAILVLLAFASFLLGAPLAQARKAGPRIDASFGQNGRVSAIAGLSGQWSTAVHKVAVAPNGDVYVAAQHAGTSGPAVVELRRYLPDGKPDPTFGDGGTVIVAGAGETHFELTELMVDSRGRPYLAGTSWADQPTTYVSPYPLGYIYPATATVIRFTTAGAPDPSYGSGGYASFEFGLPVRSPWVKPAVSTTDAVLDAEDRVVLVAAQEEIGGEAHSAFVTRQKLVARLTTNGAVDPTFGRGGLFPLPASQSVSGVFVGRSGAVDLILRPSGEEGEFQIEQLQANGRPDPSFGPGGARNYAGHEAPIAWAGETGGSSLLLESTKRDGAGSGNSTAKVMKVDAAGRPARASGAPGSPRSGCSGPPT